LTVCGNGYHNGNPSTISVAICLYKATEPSACTHGAAHSTWLGEQNNKTIASEIFPFGNSAQHKTPQSYSGVAYAMCMGRKIKRKQRYF